MGLTAHGGMPSFAFRLLVVALATGLVSTQLVSRGKATQDGSAAVEGTHLELQKAAQEQTSFFSVGPAKISEVPDCLATACMHAEARCAILCGGSQLLNAAEYHGVSELAARCGREPRLPQE